MKQIDEMQTSQHISLGDRALNLHFKQHGNGYPVLLIHGLFGSLSNLGLLAKHLEQLGYRVISIDALNHGLSPRSNSMSYRTQAAAVKAVCEELAIDQCAVVGHSMGGKIAMALAQQYPGLISTLVVADIAPVSYQHNHTAVFSGLMSFQPSTISSRLEADKCLAKHIVEPGVRQFLLKSLTKVDGQWRWLFDVEKLYACYSSIIDWSAGESFSKPCLFIKGELSDYIVADYQTQVAQQFPNASLKVIAGTGHWLHAEKPALFNRLTEQFLAAHI
ncbi:alpha/beta fold hydrolase [Agarivorans sp. TSD2052]|uniref:alpha/beta fold hydrolase n=1 Tax=Agarivorans sp. TSD2052 TaxID=2937286 RepID=UPI00200F82E8|nr:alpha/beta fold hydrolase [Agarivorans sp. TSD2052]UPW20473.1 alpha/beta fold hydrolase [Agarivorans sp. TSD2052]